MQGHKSNIKPNIIKNEAKGYDGSRPAKPRPAYPRPADPEGQGPHSDPSRTLGSDPSQTGPKVRTRTRVPDPRVRPEPDLTRDPDSTRVPDPRFDPTRGPKPGSTRGQPRVSVPSPGLGYPRPADPGEGQTWGSRPPGVIHYFLGTAHYLHFIEKRPKPSHKGSTRPQS